MHLHFMHLAADWLFELVKRANKAKASEWVQELLDDISVACKS